MAVQPPAPLVRWRNERPARSAGNTRRLAPPLAVLGLLAMLAAPALALADDRPSVAAPPPVAGPERIGEQALSVSEVLDQFDDYIETTLTIEGRLTLLGTHDAILKQASIDPAGLNVELAALPSAEQALARQRCRDGCAATITGRAGRIMGKPGVVAVQLDIGR